jgi:hypothetical protein
MRDVGEIIEDFKKELDTIKERIVVDDECMKHLYEIYSLAFVTWYDPDSKAHAKWGQQLWPHIKALNDKLKFKR